MSFQSYVDIKRKKYSLKISPYFLGKLKPLQLNDLFIQPKTQTSIQLPIQPSSMTQINLSHFKMNTPNNEHWMKKNNSCLISPRSVRVIKQLSQCVKHTGETKKPFVQVEQRQAVQNFLDKNFPKHSKNKTICVGGGSNKRSLKRKQTLFLEDPVKIQSMEFQNKLQEDELIGDLIGNTPQQQKMLYDLLSLSQNIHAIYTEEFLREKHARYNITQKQFSRFKQIYIEQLFEMDVPVDEIIKDASILEDQRRAILGQPTIMQIVGHDVGLRNLSFVCYSKIYSDYTLLNLFASVKKEEQVPKFAKLFRQIINFNDTQNYSLSILRERHIKYSLNYIQYFHFKYHLYHSMYELNMPDQFIWFVLELMDTYKFAILNKQSVKEIIEERIGWDDFLDEFMKLCSADPVLKPFIFVRKYTTFRKHSKLMFQFLLNRQQLSFTPCDLFEIHKCSNLINDDVFDHQIMHAQAIISNYETDPIILSDFFDDWYHLKPYILNQPLPYQVFGGQSALNKLAINFYQELLENVDVCQIYKENEYSGDLISKRVLQFMFCGSFHFKKVEVKVIHQRFRITEHMFDSWKKSLMRAVQRTGLSKHLGLVEKIVEQWRSYIIY